MTSIRFLQNFVMTVVTTTMDSDGQLVINESLVHVKIGDIYFVENWEQNGNSLILNFPPNGPIVGMAPNVDIGFCEFQSPAIATAAKAASSGCGCGK